MKTEVKLQHRGTMKLSVHLANIPYWPQRVLAISKLSALEFLKNQNPDLNESQILSRMEEHGTDPGEIFNEHQLQIACEKNLAAILKKLNINFRITKRISDASKCVNWADLVIPLGGDGTFLLASKLIKNNTKPLFGIDPRGAKKNNIFTLPSKYTSNIEEIFNKLYTGEYKLLMRSRIRIVMNGEGLYRQPFYVHEKSRSQGERRIQALLRSTQRKIADALQPRERILPWLALNEVFIAECLAARAITLRIKVDDAEEYTVRSSGICISTGSGSSFWYSAMNLQSADTVRKVVNIAMGRELTETEVNNLLERYHMDLVYPPDDPHMTYMIREMYRTSRCSKPKCCPERQMCHKIRVKSGGFDAGLVLDGSISLPFNDGTIATLEIRPEYALMNIILK